jgi:rhodanese-related sulfurtransferase
MTTMTTNTTPRSETLVEIEPHELKSWLDAERAILVDVREPDEHAAVRIPGAHLVPLSKFDPSKVPAGTKIVLHCRSGVRSAQAARIMRDAGHEVTTLRGGLKAWKSAGLELQRSKGVPISIMRQVQITVGAMVLISFLLGMLVHPWLHGIGAFMGAGLLFAGLSGTCALAGLLAIMPWNKTKGGCESCSE